MAWIETYNGAVNLDTVQKLLVTLIYDTYPTPYGEGECIREDKYGNCIVKGFGIIAVFSDSNEHIYIGSADDRDRLINVTHQIAQIARGNAYISQDDIRRMMHEQE